MPGRARSVTVLRVATAADIPALGALIRSSGRELSVGFYSPEQIEAAVRHIFGVDSQVIADGTYYLIEAQDGSIDGPGVPIAAGGWSARRTLYGGDQMKGAEDPMLDPAVDPARIRAFFVHPRWARRGLARRLYAECARVAWSAGFREFELIATSPGEPLYTALGFTVLDRGSVDAGGIALPFARMRRTIPPPVDTD